MNKKYLILGLCFVLGIVAGYVINNGEISDKELIDRQMNIPSQCYTNLEPSNFLSATRVSVITENHLKNYIKIDIQDRDFFYTQTKGTGSMRPFLQKYASVILIKPQVEDIKVGDVITFDCQGNIIHRVIKIENGIYTTKGDNNNIEDTKCVTKFEDITGRVVGVLY